LRPIWPLNSPSASRYLLAGAVPFASSRRGEVFEKPVTGELGNRFVEMAGTMFGLARDGKSDRKAPRAA
jgi:hypothetical protein